MGKALYTQLAQSDDDDDDDDDGAESESDSEGDAAETPWQKQVETAVTQAVEGLVAVAKPTLALVETMIKELASLFDALSEGIPLVLVRLVLDHPAHKLEIAVAQHLRTLLCQALVDPFFDDGLPRMVQALAKQLNEVMRWVNGEAAELDLSSMVAALLIDLQSARHAIVAEQPRRFGDLLKTAGSWIRPPSSWLTRRRRPRRPLRLSAPVVATRGAKRSLRRRLTNVCAPSPPRSSAG